MKNLEKAVLAIMLGKQVDEALKGGQVKLDKNKNNKLDAEDFKMLRKEKAVKESLEEPLNETVTIAKKAAKEAHEQGMNHDQASNHIFNKVADYHLDRQPEGAGGYLTRARINMAHDKGVEHYEKLAKEKSAGTIKKEDFNHKKTSQISEQEEDNATANVAGHKVTLHRHLSEPGESDTYTLHHPTGAKKVKISFEKHGDGSEVHGEKVNHAFGLEAKHKLGHKIASSMNGMGGISKFEESVELTAGEELDEMSKSMAYATGTKKAMQMKGDQPPLEKSTIKKAHDIAKAMLRKEEVEIADDADETVIVHTPFEFELKESYTFGDYLTAAKQLVGEEQAIELANEKFAKQDTSIFVEQFTRTDIEDKVKTHEKAGHKVSTPKYSTKSGKPYAEYVVTDKESGVRRKYIHHGNARSVENMGAVGKKEE